MSNGFPTGFCIRYVGQDFRPIGVHALKRRNGVAHLIEWEAACLDCAKPFTTLTPLTFGRPARRCNPCKVKRRVRCDGA